MKKHIVILTILISLVILLAGCTPPPPPELAVSISSSPLLQGSQATVHVKVKNPSEDDWQNYKLLVGYAPENDPNMGHISELPLSLAAGQTFEQDVAWLTNFQPVEGYKYQVRLALVSEENTHLGETSAPIEFTQPTVSVSINPTELNQDAQAVINVQVNNPSGVEMQNYTLGVGYGAKNDSSSYVIQDLPINLKAGETFNQDIAWIIDYIPSGGEYEIRAALITPESVHVTQAVSPITLIDP